VVCEVPLIRRANPMASKHKYPGHWGSALIRDGLSIVESRYLLLCRNLNDHLLHLGEEATADVVSEEYHRPHCHWWGDDFDIVVALTKARNCQRLIVVEDKGHRQAK
jgi:hypothetical protein